MYTFSLLENITETLPTMEFHFLGNFLEDAFFGQVCVFCIDSNLNWKFTPTGGSLEAGNAFLKVPQQNVIAPIV